MRRSFALGVLGALVLGLAAGAYAEPVKLEYKFKKDDVTKYNLAIEIKGQLPDIPELAAEMPLEFSASMLQVQRVMSVNPDGSARIKVWTGEVKVVAPGIPNVGNEKIPADTSYLTLSRTGKVLGVELPESVTSAKGSMPSISPSMMGSMQKWISELSDYGTLPAEPVEVGQAWSKTVPLPMELGKASVNNTLASVSEQFAGMRAAKITQTVSGQVNLEQVMKAFMGGLASLVGPGGSTSGIPDISGTLDVSGSFDTFFSVEQGKPLGQMGSGKMTINVKMPQELIQQGAPPTLRVIVDAKVSMKVAS